LVDWIDGPLRHEWGLLAAARVYVVCQTGYDGHFARPSERAPQKAENAYRVQETKGPIGMDNVGGSSGASCSQLFTGKFGVILGSDRHQTVSSKLD
jgi:hypothetical protein